MKNRKSSFASVTGTEYPTIQPSGQMESPGLRPVGPPWPGQIMPKQISSRSDPAAITRQGPGARLSGFHLRQCFIERLARTHHRSAFLRIRQIIAADIDGLALHGSQFLNNLLLVTGKRFSQRFELRLQL